MGDRRQLPDESAGPGLTRLRHLALALRALPGLVLDAPQRALLAEMRRFCRQLPQRLQAPLDEALPALTPSLRASPGGNADTVRRLADLAALLERRSPLGLCLRRSLVRFHFLRRAGVPVVLHCGARLLPAQTPAGAARRLTGHAWLTLDDQPYHEAAEDWRGFTVLLSHPAPRA